MYLTLILKAPSFIRGPLSQELKSQAQTSSVDSPYMSKCSLPPCTTRHCYCHHHYHPITLMVAGLGY